MGFLDRFSDKNLKDANLVLGVIGFGSCVVGLLVSGPAVVGIGIVAAWGQVAITEALREKAGTPIDTGNSDFRCYILNQTLNLPPAFLSTIGPVIKNIPGVRLSAGVLQLLDGVNNYLGLKLGPVGIALNAVDVFNSCAETGIVPDYARIKGINLDDSSFSYTLTGASTPESEFTGGSRTDPNSYYVEIILHPGDGWDKLEEIYGPWVRMLNEYNTVLNPGTRLKIPVTGDERQNIYSQLRTGDKYIAQIGTGGTYSDVALATGNEAEKLEIEHGTPSHELQIGEEIVIFEKKEEQNDADFTDSAINAVNMDSNQLTSKGESYQKASYSFFDQIFQFEDPKQVYLRERTNVNSLSQISNWLNVRQEQFFNQFTTVFKRMTNDITMSTDNLGNTSNLWLLQLNRTLLGSFCKASDESKYDWTGTAVATTTNYDFSLQYNLNNTQNQFTFNNNRIIKPTTINVSNELGVNLSASTNMRWDGKQYIVDVELTEQTG